MSRWYDSRDDLERSERDARPAYPDRSNGSRKERSQPRPNTRPAYLDRPFVPPRDRPSRHLQQDIGQRQVYQYRGHDYRLSHNEITVLRDVGRFRILDSQDLARFVYRGEQDTVKRDLRHLEDNKLIRFISLPGRDRTKYATLTKAGKDLFRDNFNRIPGQEIYSGTKKLREAEHDAAVYRAYQAEVERMEEHGVRPRRVRLDFELKRDIQRDLARARQKDGKDLLTAKREVAAMHHLVTVDNVIQIPDLRIEYEGSELEMGGGTGEVDIEYVSDHYKPGQITAKRAAGFVLYGNSQRGRSSHGPDIMMEILR